MKKMILVIGFCVFLSSCKYSLKVEIYLGDITEWFTEQKNALHFVESQIKIDVNSYESCVEKSQQITNTIAEFYGEIKDIQCIKERYDGYYAANIQMPIFFIREDYEEKMNEELNRQLTKYPSFLLTVIPKSETKNLFPSAMVFSLQNFESLKKRIKNEYNQTIEAKDFNFSVRIHNDLRTTQDMVFTNVYLNGFPHPRAVKVPLKRRKNILVEFPQIQIDYIFQDLANRYLDILRFKSEES